MNHSQLENLNFFLNRSERIIGSREKFLDYLNLTEDSYNKYSNSLGKLPHSSILLICNELDLRYQDILSGTLDYKSIYEHFNNNKMYLREEYTEHAKSRIKTLKNVFEYLNPFYSHELIAVLNELQVNESIFIDPSRRISVKLIDDAFLLLEKYGICKEMAFQTGKNGADLLKEYTEFYSDFNTCKSIQDVYELCFKDKIRVIDGTWDYSIEKLSETECILKVTTRESARDYYKKASFGSENFKHYRAGITNGLASYLNDHLSQTLIEDYDDSLTPYSLFKTKFFKKPKALIQH